MKQGVEIIKQKYPEVSSLRDVPYSMLQEFKLKMDPVIFNRCTYVIEEKERVLNAVEALKKGSFTSTWRIYV